jgi:hypothetical protein
MVVHVGVGSRRGGILNRQGKVRPVMADIGLGFSDNVLDGDWRGHVMMVAAASVSDASDTNLEVAMAIGPLVPRSARGKANQRDEGLCWMSRTSTPRLAWGLGLWCHASGRGESKPKGEDKEDERVEDGRDEGLREGLQNYADLSN